MKLLAWSGFLWCLLICFAISPANGQSRINTSGNGGIHTIKGRIFTPNGRSTDSQIKVRLESTSNVDLSLITDINGGFTFQAVAPGSYTVVVDAGDQFEVFRESVVIDAEIQGAVPIRPIPKVFTVPVYLRVKIRPPGDKPGVVDAKYADVPKDAINHYEKGLEFDKAGKSEEALAEFKQAIAIYPALEPAHVESGKIYLKRSRLDDAINSFRMAVRYDPKDFDAKLNYAVALYNAKQLDEARRELADAAKLNGTAVWPHYYLGLIDIQTKDLDAAQQELEKAKTLTGDKKIPLLHRYLGGVYAAKRLNDLAVVELERYVQLAPDARDIDRIRQTIAELRNNKN